MRAALPLARLPLLLAPRALPLVALQFAQFTGAANNNGRVSLALRAPTHRDRSLAR